MDWTFFIAIFICLLHNCGPSFVGEHNSVTNVQSIGNDSNVNSHRHNASFTSTVKPSKHHIRSSLLKRFHNSQLVHGSPIGDSVNKNNGRHMRNSIFPEPWINKLRRTVDISTAVKHLSEETKFLHKSTTTTTTTALPTPSPTPTCVDHMKALNTELELVSKLNNEEDELLSKVQKFMKKIENPKEAKRHSTKRRDEGENDSLEALSNPATPGLEALSNPATPLDSGTHSIGTPVSDQDMDRSIFSMSMDSGIGSPASYGFQQSNITNIRSLKPSMASARKMSNKAKTANTIEHSNKEKRRRERIKGSCHQIRVLLPYIQGRKTDMASILEMCVDYLRIVNMCMPQTLQEQIVDLMSKKTSSTENKEDVKLENNENNSPTTGIKRLLTASLSSSKVVVEPVEKTSPSPQSSKKSTGLAEIADNFDVIGKKTIRLMPAKTHDKVTIDNHLDARLEPTLAGHSDIAPRFQNSIFTKAFSTEKSFGRDHLVPSCSSSGYNSAQQLYSSYSNKSSILESSMYRPSYGSSEGAFYQYYPSRISNISSTSRLYNTADFANNNAVAVPSSLTFAPIFSRHDSDPDHHNDDLNLV